MLWQGLIHHWVLVLVDEDGNEDFQGVMKQLRRKDHQIENPVYMMFDMLSKSDFDKGKSTELLEERLHKLRSVTDGSNAQSITNSHVEI